jgi:hypothetical protein
VHAALVETYPRGSWPACVDGPATPGPLSAARCAGARHPHFGSAKAAMPHQRLVDLLESVAAALHSDERVGKRVDTRQFRRHVRIEVITRCEGR